MKNSEYLSVIPFQAASRRACSASAAAAAASSARAAGASTSPLSRSVILSPAVVAAGCAVAVPIHCATAGTTAQVTAA